MLYMYVHVYFYSYLKYYIYTTHLKIQWMIKTAC